MFALAVEFIGLARAAALASRMIRCCLPENYMIPYNREVSEMLRAAFDDVQEVRTLGCGKGEGWTPLPVNMPAIPHTHM